MKISVFILLTMFSLGLSAAGKSAFINTKELLEKSPQAITANKQLQEQFGGREQSLRDLAQNIQQMEETYKNDSAIMSEEQKNKAQENIVQNKRRFQFEQQSLKEDLQARQRELLKDVQVEIRKAIQAYGAEHGYDFIFTDNSIAYASDAVDITDKILLELQK